jgi:hypothetical protein
VFRVYSGQIHLDKKVGRECGAQFEILSGLSEGDTVVLNPTDAVHEGVTVEPNERVK